MTTLQISFSFSGFNSLCDDLSKKRRWLGFKFQQPINFYPLSRRKIRFLSEDWLKVRSFADNSVLFGEIRGENGSLMREGKREKNNRVVLVRFNQGSGFNGGGGGGRDNSNNARILGNLALAIGLTYLSFTGQLGWVLDAIVSIWLLAVLLPIAGLGAFLWWAGRDIVQSSCPNCGNNFQIFKSSLNDDPQLCPFCSQPFTVEGNDFVRATTKFSSNRSNQSTTFGQAFNDFASRSKKGNDSSVTVVDVEAEVKDVD